MELFDCESVTISIDDYKILLSFASKIDECIKTIKWPSNIIKISLQNCKNIDILYDNWPTSLETLYINGVINDDIKWPSSLHTLSINNIVTLPESLHTLMWDAIGTNINIISMPRNLHTLEFSHEFDHVIPVDLDISHINTLLFKYRYNQCLSHVNLQSLEKLIFYSDNLGCKYNKSMTNTSMPSIQYLEFCVHYNQPLRSWSTLQTLILGREFNQPFDAIILQELHTLIFKTISIYNQDISKLHAPKLSTLTLSGNFNYDITNINFPLLETLTLSRMFNKNIDNVKFLNLITLTFGVNFKQDISLAKFEKLETIFDHSCGITEKSCNFPNTLYKIIYISIYDEKTTIYTRNTGLKTKAAR
jgi:hypothetical protein